MTQSGHSGVALYTSAFGGKPDMAADGPISSRCCLFCRYWWRRSL